MQRILSDMKHHTKLNHKYQQINNENRNCVLKKNYNSQGKLLRILTANGNHTKIELLGITEYAEEILRLFDDSEPKEKHCF